MFVIATFSHDILLGKVSKISTATIVGGLVEHSRMVEYLYQLRYCIGTDGKKIPNELMTFKLPFGNGHNHLMYNPTEVIMQSADIILTLNGLLSKHTLLESDIESIEILSVLCQLATTRLFMLKQLLSGSNNNSYVVKLHMLMHFFIFIRLFGQCQQWDTDRSEHAHIEVKQHEQSSSKRQNVVQLEILQRDRSLKITKMAMENKKILRNEMNITSPSSNISRFSSKVSSNITPNTHKVKRNFIANHGNVLADDIESFNEDEDSVDDTFVTIINNISNTVLLESFTTSNDDSINCNWKPKESIGMQIPLHPLITIKNLNQLLDGAIRNPDLSEAQGWKNEIVEAKKRYKPKWRLSLLSGIRVTIPKTIFGDIQSFMVYSRRDYNVQRNELTNNRKQKYTDVFNCVEVKSDGIGDMVYCPARVFGILKLYQTNNKQQSTEPIILLLIAYLRPARNMTTLERKLYLPNSLYEYWFVNEHLWLDLIEPSRITCPLSCLYDVHRR